MSKIKKVLLDWRVLLMLALILFSIILISPAPWIDGAAVRTVEKNSSAELGGMISASPNTPPRQREIITAINGNAVDNAATYYALEKDIPANISVQIRTNKKTYRLITKKS